MLRNKVLGGLIATLMTLSLVIAPAVAEEEKTVKFDFPNIGFYGFNEAFDSWTVDKIVDEMKSPDHARIVYANALFRYLYPNYEPTGISWDMWSAQAGEKLITALATGSAPAFYVCERIGGTQTAAAKGLLADITDLVNASEACQALKKSYGSLWVPQWQDGRCYSIPRDAMQARLIFYRRDFFRDAGIFDAEGKAAPPKEWTTEDFVSIAQKLTSPKEQRWGYTMQGSDWLANEFKAWSQVFGAPLVVPDASGKNTWKSGLDTPVTIEVAQFMKDLVWKYKCTLAGADQSWVGNREKFLAGQAAMTLSISQDFGGGEKMPGRYTDLEIYPAPWPKGPTGVRINNIEMDEWGFNSTLSKEELKAAFDFYIFFVAGLGKRAAYVNYGDRYFDGMPLTTHIYTPWPVDHRMEIVDYRTYAPERAKVHDLLLKDPVAPLPEAYGLYLQNKMSLDANTMNYIQTFFGSADVDVEKQAKEYAKIANTTILDYKIKGQTVDNFREYYTALDKFYKDNFPTYYEEMFKSLWEDYFKAW